jgi:quinol-cytochrome oxidoreductase complex cytochrome b subunit
VAALCLVTMGVVWGILYASFSLVIFPPDPSLAFAPVEYIARDTPWDWVLRYVAEVLGWLVGLLYFWACWGVAWFWPSRAPDAT